MLRVSPIIDSMMIEPSTASGIEVAMMMVERQLPRNSRIITLVRERRDDAFAGDAGDGAAGRRPTDRRRRSIFSAGGSEDLNSSTFFLMPAMISSVEIEPAFSTIISTERLPLTCTMLVCGGLPSRIVGDVSHIDHRAVDGLDREIAEFLDLQRRVVELHGIFEQADFFRAHRRDQVLRSQRVGDVLAGQAERLQRGRIEVDLDLPLLTAIGVGDRCAGDCDQRRAQLVDAEVGEVLFGQAFARQRELG